MLLNHRSQVSRNAKLSASRRVEVNSIERRERFNAEDFSRISVSWCRLSHAFKTPPHNSDLQGSAIVFSRHGSGVRRRSLQDRINNRPASN